MGHEDHLRGHGKAVEAKAPFGGGDQVVHYQADVVHVQARAVEGAVVDFAAEEFYNTTHAALPHGVFAFHDEAASAHAHDGSVATFVEGEGGFFEAVFGGGRADGEETRADPFHHVVAGDVIRANDNDAAAASGANPILGDGNALGGGGAGGVDLGIGAARADVLSELAVPHGKDAEEEAAVKGVRLLRQLVAQLVDAAVDFPGGLWVVCVAT